MGSAIVSYLAPGASITGGLLTLNVTSGYAQFGSQIVPTSGSYTVALWARTGNGATRGRRGHFAGHRRQLSLDVSLIPIF